jgi:hypothetical protein
MVANIVMWDPVASPDWTPPTNTTAVEDAADQAVIRGWYDDPDFKAIMPKITSIDPATGPAAGGTTVTIQGLNLDSPGVVVKFDGVDATNLQNITDTSLQCDTPAHAAGTVDVTVENTAGSWTGQNVLTDGFEYTA